MAYKENEVVAKYTKGNSKSDCGKYSVNDLLEMFDLAMVTKNELGDFESFNVNQCVSDSNRMLINLVVTSECDDMFCYYNNETVVPCSADFDYEAYYSCS